MKKYIITIYSPKLLALHLLLVLAIIIPILLQYLFFLGGTLVFLSVLLLFLIYYGLKKYRSASVEFRMTNKGINVVYIRSFPFEKNESHTIPWNQINNYYLRETKPTEYLTVTMKNGNKYRWYTNHFELRDFYYDFKQQAAIKTENSNNINIQKVPHYLTSKTAKIVALIILSLILIELILYLLGIEISIYHMGVFFPHLIGINFLLVVTIYHFRKKPFY